MAGCDVERANLVDMVSDEFGESEDIDNLLQRLAYRLLKNFDQGYIRPQTFLGVGGMKIFRDDIWGKLRFVFQADHKYFEEHGLYDFPQNDKDAIAFSEQMIEATKDPEKKEEIRKMLKMQMVVPLENIVASY